MGSAFHQLCPRYSGTLTPTAPTATRLWDSFTFTFLYLEKGKNWKHFECNVTVDQSVPQYSSGTFLGISHVTLIGRVGSDPVHQESEFGTYGIVILAVNTRSGNQIGM